MVKFSIDYLDNLLKKYGKDYPRRTEITTFTEVVARKVAISNLTCGYDPQTGFLGYHIKAEPEHTFACSEYDKFILISKDGHYKVINGTDKLFVGQDMMYVGKADSELVFNIIYRDGKEALSYIKRFHMPKFILDKEYRLFPEDKKSWIQYLSTGNESRLRVYLIPSKRAKMNSVEVIFNDYLIKGTVAKGKRVATRGVRRIVPLVDKEVFADDNPQPSLPGLKDKPDDPDKTG
jgi:topoisomerase-4 subunit A